MINSVNLLWGMGDALNSRAFLINYCRQKNINPKDIQIYCRHYSYLFKFDKFTIKSNKINFGNTIPYRNFGFYNLTRLYNLPKNDENIAKNADINFSFNDRELLNWNTPLPTNITLPKKFITVNYGSDNDRPEGTVCIKLWNIKYWEYLVKNIGIPCIQLGGGKNCVNIPGIYLNLVNKLSIFESAEVMKRALFHIDIEGGLPILNQHLGGKSVVLFGPTAIENQGRNFNLNLRSNTCTPCYEWGTKLTNRLCVKPNSMVCNMHCMLDLKPDYVIEQIYKNKWL